MREKATKNKKRTLVRWSAGDIKKLKKMARKHPVTAIAKVLRRSVAAVRYKAHIVRLSLKT